MELLLLQLPSREPGQPAPPSPESSGESPMEQDEGQGSLLFQYILATQFSNDVKQHTLRRGWRRGTQWGKMQLLAPGRAYPPWDSLRTSQWSLQNWGHSEVIENNLRSMSMENVYLDGNF